jgi:hypothetical protein
MMIFGLHPSSKLKNPSPNTPNKSFKFTIAKEIFNYLWKFQVFLSFHPSCNLIRFASLEQYRKSSIKLQ